MTMICKVCHCEIKQGELRHGLCDSRDGTQGKHYSCYEQERDKARADIDAALKRIRNLVQSIKRKGR